MAAIAVPVVGTVLGVKAMTEMGGLMGYGCSKGNYGTTPPPPTVVTSATPAPTIVQATSPVATPVVATAPAPGTPTVVAAPATAVTTTPTVVKAA